MTQAGENINSRGTAILLHCKGGEAVDGTKLARDAAVDKMVMPEALGDCPEPGHRRGLESLVNFYSLNLLIRRCFPMERV